MVKQAERRTAQRDQEMEPYRFDVDQYHRMGETGILAPDARVELLEGEVVPMPPIRDGHLWGVNFIADVLAGSLGQRAIVSVQNPVLLSPRTEPQPDIAVIRRPVTRPAPRPTAGDVYLVIEVSDTTVQRDRTVKLPLYARAGIGEAWIVNLGDGCIEVYRDPQRGRYRERTVYERGQSISPLAFPDIVVAVDAILP